MYLVCTMQTTKKQYSDILSTYYYMRYLNFDHSFIISELHKKYFLHTDFKNKLQSLIDKNIDLINESLKQGKDKLTIQTIK